MNKQSEMEKFYNLFPVPEMARDITNILEDFRIDSRLKTEYPALGDQINYINIKMLSKRPSLKDLLSDKQRAVEIIGQKLIAGKTNEEVPPTFEKPIDYALSLSEVLKMPGSDIHDSASIAADLYFFIDEFYKDLYRPVNSFSALIDQSKYNQYVGNEESLLKKQSKAARKNQSRDEDDKNDNINEREKEEEFFNEAKTEETPLSKQKTGSSNIYDFNPMQSLLTKSPEDSYKENEKPTKSLSLTFDENGIRPKDEDPGYDSLKNESWSNKLIHLNSYISDKRELEYKPDTFLYPEWGADISCYRANWARVNEQTLSGKSSGFYREAMQKHAGLVKKVKREFQMLRPEGLAKLKRRLDGEEIDLDSTVEYFIDKRLGITPSEKNYIRIKKSTRDIAVSFLVDMSGSTRGSTINLEKEALVIMSEALCELGDAFSIYGFSGHTREKVDFFIIKEFSDIYDQKITRRISEIKDNYGTRIGPAIRHSIHKLMQRNEKIKMLILLSDGKPEDKDYYDNYAIEDTRIALKEGQKQGIRPFCITVDNKAPEYLHRMYSHSNWVVINDVSKLPLKITRIYKRLTT